MKKANCQFCQSQFLIEQTDEDFYAKLGVNLPTFCPSCRFQRRLTWRNERILSRRICEWTGKEIISCFPENSKVKVVDRDLWWQTEWDAREYGLEYENNSHLFLQVRSLMSAVPFPALFSGLCENGSYCNHVGELKDCYLTFASWNGEGNMFCNLCSFCKNCVDCTALFHSELCYECVHGDKLYNCRYMVGCNSCHDSSFCVECVSCKNCFGCSNLRHREFCFENQQCTPQEYKSFLASKNLHLTKSRLAELARMQFNIAQMPHRYAQLTNCEDVTGDYMTGTKSCFECYFLDSPARDCKYTMNGGFHLTDTYDSYGVGAHAELLYECVDCGNSGSNLTACVVVWESSNIAYSINCQGCRDCLGCVGLRGRQHCILNRQYTSEEYHELRQLIVKSMNDNPYCDIVGRKYVFGDFFPAELSPFCYNETLAAEYYPLSEVECRSNGLSWQQQTTKSPKITLKITELPDGLLTQLDFGALLGQVIECPGLSLGSLTCAGAFRLTKQELDWYEMNKIQLPRSCPNCRHRTRIDFRRPPRLLKRRCDYINPNNMNQCMNIFLTSFEAGRASNVYCEECYQREFVK